MYVDFLHKQTVGVNGCLGDEGHDARALMVWLLRILALDGGSRRKCVAARLCFLIEGDEAYVRLRY